MKYICIHCGHHFEEIDRKHYDRAAGVWEEYCPNCGSEDFEEAVHCIKCDEFVPEDNMVGSICKGCLEKRINDEEALAYGNDRKEAVELNGFLAYIFSASEIEYILKANIPKGYARRYITDDIYDFSEWEENND